MRRKAVKNYFTRMCEEKSGDQRKFWDTIKPFINSCKQTNPSRIILKDNGKIIKDNVEVAETLNTFFTGAGDRNGQFSNAVNQETAASTETTTGKPLLSLGKTNSIEVLEVMKKLRPNKATGHDLIPPKVIQQAAGVLCHHFSTLFNYVLDQAKIPQQWKLAEISPAHKKECKLTKSNYRQLSILPSLSKVFERLVHNRASPYFENILHKFVFAYRKFHGCDTALLCLTENWKRELDNQKIVGLVSMDLSKAFDMLQHELIMNKLRQFADEDTCRLLESYLTGRRQRVKLGGEHSSWQPIRKGIPQGSILGPLLFNIFMNDLHEVPKNTTLSTYADDTQIFYAGKNEVELEQAISTDLKRVDEWFDKNKMQRNPSKYTAIVFGNLRTGPPRFVCENTVIPLNEKVELLGVTIDKKLKFDAHVAKICRRVSQQVAVLRRMKKMLPFETRMKLYQSFIVPHFNYCAETWNFCSKGATTKLEKLNERALRFVYRDYSSSYEMLLKQSGYQTLLNQRLAKILTTVYKVVNGQGVSESLCDLVELRESNYNLRGDKILTLPKVNTTKYGLKSLRYKGANLWNKLPNEYRKADSYKLFKKQISDTDLAGRYMS